MKKLLELKNEIEKLQSTVADQMSDKQPRYWVGGDWQIQGLEKAYSNVLKEIEKLMS